MIGVNLLEVRLGSRAGCVQGVVPRHQRGHAVTSETSVTSVDIAGHPPGDAGDAGERDREAGRRAEADLAPNLTTL